MRSRWLEGVTAANLPNVSNGLPRWTWWATTKPSGAIVEDFAANGGMIGSQDLREYEIDIEPPIEGVYRGLRVTAPPAPASGEVVLDILKRLEPTNLVSLGHNGPSYVAVVAEAMRGAFAAMRRSLGDAEFVPARQETTQVTTTDAVGNCVTLTHSLGGRVPPVL